MARGFRLVLHDGSIVGEHGGAVGTVSNFSPKPGAEGTGGKLGYDQVIRLRKRLPRRDG
jgi:hypothetical protein